MNNQLIGYGEDSLTFWALKDQLSVILEKLEGKSQVDSCVVFYRPSFGRGKNIGEFDAIIATPDCVYLIESKWDQSNEYHKTTRKVVLREAQWKRHDTFMVYRECWNCSDLGKWDEFAGRLGPIAEEKMPDHKIPDSSTQLAKSLEVVLSKCWQQGKEQTTKNVCLFFSESSSESVENSEQRVQLECADGDQRKAPQFELIEIEYRSHEFGRQFVGLD